ncbi:hypothetical protein L202_06716 [Cryptococcus amylolentus CBS 6039]|uniref:Uncharacterized protein n=1 Tax=Cryptococcus amylolentus CBS 6039 TaxID=1295533 RepID=A0A1E3HGY1_9TREE|nr:hypothetical protein L202_06716 [Cryptococcus amylolentus CBS 6039]ODN75597.1 hypothetical protein L202_06716 [Cryptococcus amylolentus CBS 6039]
MSTVTVSHRVAFSHLTLPNADDHSSAYAPTPAYEQKIQAYRQSIDEELRDYDACKRQEFKKRVEIWESITSDPEEKEKIRRRAEAQLASAREELVKGLVSDFQHYSQVWLLEDMALASAMNQK